MPPSAGAILRPARSAIIARIVTAATESGPLADIRVLDLAGRQLGELGADVVRVEPPGGDGTRRRRPFLDGEAGVERSLYHLHFNVNKRGLVLDLDRPRGVDALRRLAAAADVLIETRAPGEMDALGAGYDDLRELNPGLIYTTVTPFGQQGAARHYRGNDLIGAATSGLMYLNGMPEDPPNQPGSEQAYHMASLVAASGTLMAIVARERDREHRGRRVDVSIQEAASMATLQTANANLYTWHGQIPRRHGMGAAAGRRGLFQCRDGLWVHFTIPPPFGDSFVEWLNDAGIESPLGSAEWREMAYRMEHGEVVSRAIDKLGRCFDRARLFHEGQRRRLLVMPVNTVEDLLVDEQLQARDYFAQVEHPELGRTLTDAGVPYHFSATAARVHRRAPLLGEHTEEVFREWIGMSAEELAAEAVL